MRGLIRSLARMLCLLLIVSFMIFDTNAHSVRAGMVGTETILYVQTEDGPRARVTAFFKRQDVEAAMASWGITPSEARERVASLTDAEIRGFTMIIDQLPAGGDGLSSVVSAALFVFVLLLVTDILGLTRVFPFTRPVR
jgi:hypothetical protein